MHQKAYWKVAANKRIRLSVAGACNTISSDLLIGILPRAAAASEASKWQIQHFEGGFRHVVG
jgi:hypothetical protein